MRNEDNLSSFFFFVFRIPRILFGIRYYSNPIILIIGVVLSSSLAAYRRHVLRLRVGNDSFLPKMISRREYGTTSIMRASLFFAGYQVGVNILAKIPYFFPHLFLISSSFFQCLTIENLYFFLVFGYSLYFFYPRGGRYWPKYYPCRLHPDMTSLSAHLSSP